MEYKREAPAIDVYSMDKRINYGGLTHVTSFTENVRFNAISQIDLKVQKYIYDEHRQEWILNPNYDKLIKNNLLKLDDDTKYFKYPVRKVTDENKSYGIDRNTVINRSKYSTTIGEACVNTINFKLQNETELLDIGTKAGYNFQWCSFFNNGGFEKHSDSPDSNPHYGYSNYRLLACDSFIPISKYDVLALRSIDGDGNLTFYYNVMFYTDANTASFTKSLYDGYSSFSNRGCHRVWIDPDEYLNGNDKGYCRIEIYDETASKKDNVYSWTYPESGFIKLYSGQRHCNIIYNLSKDGLFEPLMKWFIIDNVEETNEGFNSYKTLTAYSYEYSLTKRTFSMSSNTIPLYTPPNVMKSVDSYNWGIDCVNNSLYTGKQSVPKGVLNYILDYLPNWGIGHISQKLMTRYRKFDDLDNANIYSFLMNDFQKAYQCFVVFDNEEQTISVYTQYDVLSGTIFEDGFALEQINSEDSYAKLSWDNIVKQIQISDNDTMQVTALRVHTANNTYGLGLVNPTGNNVLYDFSSVKNLMEYKVSYNRTLNEALEKLEREYEKVLADYRKSGKKLIGLNISLIKQKSMLATVLADYKAIADTINTFIESDYKDRVFPKNYPIPEKPMSYDDLTMNKSSIYYPDGYFQIYHSKTLYQKLRDIVNTYGIVKNEYDRIKYDYDDTISKMKTIAKKVKFKIQNVIDKGILTVRELTELDKYIIEGDWRNDNVTFSETYDADDIYDTLVDVYNQAKQDLTNLLSKQQYEFTVDTANILAIPEMSSIVQNIHLGHCLNIEKNYNNTNDYINAMLLEVFIDYKDDTKFTMTFSTDYTRRPSELRFSELFSTISQTSVETKEFTFDD